MKTQTLTAPPAPVAYAPEYDTPTRTLPTSYEEQTRGYVDAEGCAVNPVLETARIRAALFRKYGVFSLNHQLLPVLFAPDGIHPRRHLPTCLRRAQLLCQEYDVRYWEVSNEDARQRIDLDEEAMIQLARTQAVIYIDSAHWRGEGRYTYVGHTSPDHYNPPLRDADGRRNDAYEAACFWGQSEALDMEIVAFVHDLARETGLRRLELIGGAEERHPLSADVLRMLGFCAK